jgi:recombination protein RecR
VLRSLEEIAALAGQRGAAVLKVHIENDMHLVSLEPGRIEFRPSSRAPRTLAADLAQKLKEWTGIRWVVTVAREGGAATLGDSKKAAHAAKLEAVAQDPMVRAVLDRFPGSEIVHVREKMEDDVPSAHRKTLPLDGGIMANLSCRPSKSKDWCSCWRSCRVWARARRARAALVLLKKREALLEPLATAMQEAAAAIRVCETCGNLDTTTPCSLCRDPRRDEHVLCVVEDVADLWALERASVFRGRYHVLGGSLSALDGVTPERLNIASLMARIGNGIEEVILAMNATVEGQTTAHYLMDMLTPSGVKGNAPRPWRARGRRTRLSRRRHAVGSFQGQARDVTCE